MIYFLMVIFFLVTFCIVGLILLQEGKGGGLAAASTGSMDSVMGARNPLRRWTTYFVVTFLLLVLGINFHISRLTPVAVPKGLTPPPPKERLDAPSAPLPSANDKETGPAGQATTTAGAVPEQIKPTVDASGADKTKTPAPAEEKTAPSAKAEESARPDEGQPAPAAR